MGTPIKLSETPGRIESQLLVLGQHTEEVLMGLLAMDAPEIDVLRKEQVI
ncbi:MAG: hypothetical protein ACE5Z5_06855 [Candidatus Bathyarchaeia archaeon]